MRPECHTTKCVPEVVTEIVARKVVCQQMSSQPALSQTWGVRSVYLATDAQGRKIIAQHSPDRQMWFQITMPLCNTRIKSCECIHRWYTHATWQFKIQFLYQSATKKWILCIFKFICHHKSTYNRTDWPCDRDHQVFANCYSCYCERGLKSSVFTDSGTKIN